MQQCLTLYYSLLQMQYLVHLVVWVTLRQTVLMALGVTEIWYR